MSESGEIEGEVGSCRIVLRVSGRPSLPPSLFPFLLTINNIFLALISSIPSWVMPVVQVLA